MVFSVTKMTFFPAGKMIWAAKKIIFAAVQVFPAILQRIFVIRKVFPAIRKIDRAACSSFRRDGKGFPAPAVYPPGAPTSNVLDFIPYWK